MSRTESKAGALKPIVVRLACGCTVAYKSDTNIMPRVGELVWCFKHRRNEEVRKARRGAG